MSKYTTALRYIIESINDYSEEESFKKGFDYIEQNINDARQYIFSFPYPFYSDSENDKKAFEKKFLRHFYTREIGTETFGLFQLRLSQKLNEIMPYYRDIFKSIIDFDIEKQLFDKTTVETEGTNTKNGNNQISGSNTGTQTVNTTNTGTQTVNATNTGTVTDQGSNTGTQRIIDTREDINKFSDTPQGAIDNTKLNGYMTNLTIDNNSGDSTRTDNLASSNTRTDNLTNNSLRTDNLTNNSMRTDNLANSSNGSFAEIDGIDTTVTTTYEGTKGKTKSELIELYRNTIINIDESIFNECNELFMLIY